MSLSQTNSIPPLLRRTFQTCLISQVSMIAAHAAADCVVVFNEVMYHPTGPDAATQEAREWIELRNQMTVDIDMSRWSLAGGLSYTFPANTILPAGGRIV